MSDKAFRVKASWGDGSGSYFYFGTEAEARAFDPVKTKINLLTGQSSGVINARRSTVQKRGPRGGYRTVKPSSQPGNK